MQLPVCKPGAIIIEGHIQGLSNTRSLGEAGIPVYVVDKTDCIARYSKYCLRYFLCPDFIKDDFAEFLIKLAQKEQLRGWTLIPSNDHAVITLAKHKNSLSKYYKVITPSLEIIENIYNKSKMLQTAEENGVPTPVTYYFKTENDAIPLGFSFPVLTRGKFGLSFYKVFKKKAFLAKNEMQLRDQLTYIATKYDIKSTFTQELIPFDGKNKTISFTAFCHYGDIKTYWMGVKLREHPPEFGTATFAQSIDIPKCYDQSVPLLKKLRYTGVCEIEYLFDPREKQYKLIEINARTWLWVGLARTCGVDYAKIIYDFMNETEILYPQKYELGNYWINPVSDTFYAVYAMIKRKLGIKEYIKSVCRKKISNDLFLKGDFKPGIRYLLKLFSFLKYR